MALQFNPGAYFQVRQAADENRQRDRQMVADSLSTIPQSLIQYSQQKQGMERQSMLDQLIRSKEERDQMEAGSKYGTPISPDIMMGGQSGQPAKLFTRSGQSQQVPTASPMPLRDAFDKWRAGGMARSGAQPEYMPALSQDERKIFQDSQNPNMGTISYQAKEYIDERGKSRIGRFNPRTGMIEKSPQDEYAPQTARGETAGNLRKEFIDRPEVKDFQTINTQIKSMDALFQRSMQGDMQSKNFLDQALISIFNKINDPTSVIRESEYARTPEGLALINRLQGSLEKITAGGAGLTDPDRQDLVAAAKIIGNQRGSTYTQTRSGYVNLANQMSFDPSLITATMPEFSPYQMGGGSPNQGGQGGAPMTATNPQTGEKIQSLDGGQTWGPVR